MTKPLKRKQFISFMLSPEWIADPARAEPELARMAEDGYAVAILFVRHMRADLLDAAVHDAVKTIAGMAHARGLKFMLDTDWLWWGERFVASNPQARAGVVGGFPARAVAGAFEFHAAYPRVPGMILFDRVAALYKLEGGNPVAVPEGEYHCEWQSGTPDMRVSGVCLRGRLKDGYSGELRAYVLFKAFGLPDVAHPDYLAAQRALLESYRDVPLDGIGWDEPGKGLSQLTCFKCGEGFLRLFRERNGYDWFSRLILMDHGDGTAEAVRTRLDYFETLADANHNAQRAHNEQARQLFGAHILLGTHQTWSGLPADLAAGYADYFRHGKLLTAAWTDGGWSYETRIIAFNLALADGLRHELGLRDAYYNDWSQLYPAVEEMRFANRHKMLYHVNNFLMDYSDFCEGHVNFRFDDLRAHARAEVEYLDAFDAMVAGRAAYTDIAWLYGWEGMAAAPKWLARAAYSALPNVALQLADRNLFPRLIGMESVRRAAVGADGSFTVGALRYRILIAPYAHALPKDVYEKLMALAAAGIAVVFVGAPPEFSTAGDELREDFARRVGIKPFGITDYQAAFAATGKLPGPDAYEPEYLEFVYPVQPTDGSVTRDAEGRIIAVRAAKCPLHYLPAADPREDLANLVAPLSRPFAPAYADNAYLRFFTGDDPGAFVLLAAAKGRAADAPLTPDCVRNHTRPVRKRREMRALVKLPAGELELGGGAWCAVRFEEGAPAAWIGETGAVIWNGRALSPAARSGR